MVERLKTCLNEGPNNRELASHIHPPHLRMDALFDIGPNTKYNLMSLRSQQTVVDMAYGHILPYDGPEEFKYDTDEENTREQTELKRLRDKCQWDIDPKDRVTRVQKINAQLDRERALARLNNFREKAKGRASI
jgi:hypothetical protein